MWPSDPPCLFTIGRVSRWKLPRISSGREGETDDGDWREGWVRDWSPGFHKPCGAITVRGGLPPLSCGVSQQRGFRRGGSLATWKIRNGASTPGRLFPTGAGGGGQTPQPGQDARSSRLSCVEGKPAQWAGEGASVVASIRRPAGRLRQIRFPSSGAQDSRRPRPKEVVPKEGSIYFLLSLLQRVLWAECMAP